MELDLKPCPNCGWRDLEIELPDPPDAKFGTISEEYYLVCSNCGQCTKSHSFEVCILEWNMLDTRQTVEDYEE